jgi:hypothetical protein
VLLANLTGGDRVTAGRQVPYCLFTDPELARVGLSEREARERGVAYRQARLPKQGVLRARTLSETRGSFYESLRVVKGPRRGSWPFFSGRPHRFDGRRSTPPRAPRRDRERLAGSRGRQ